MRLIDILPKFYGKHIRVGFNNGTSFFYCDLCTEESVKKIKYEQKKFSDAAKNSYENAKHEYDLFASNGVNVYEYRMKKAGKKWNRSEVKERFNNLLESKRNFSKKAKERYIYLSTVNPDFILNAEYVKHFNSYDPEEPGVIIILLEGSFNGEYWNESEYLGKPYNKSKTVSNESCIDLACAVLSSAVKSSDKRFFYSDTFDLYMPGYNGSDIWNSLKSKGLVHERKGLYCSSL